MKILVNIFLWAFSSGINAQELKTIYANEKQVIGLFFPRPIRRAVVGSEKFTFSYNKERPQHIGLLQGRLGPQSNLLVLTDNGEVYSYLLAYGKVLDTLNYFVKAKESIGWERPGQMMPSLDFKIASKVPEIDSQYQFNSLQDRTEYFRQFSAFHLKRNRNNLKKIRKNGFVLRLINLIHDRSEVYAFLEIKNRSGIDFEVDYLKIYKVNGNDRKKASYQKLLLPPIYLQKFPDLVKDEESTTFAIVLPKFTLGDSEKLLLELKELKGGRMFNLEYH